MITNEVIGAAAIVREILMYTNCYDQKCEECPFYAEGYNTCLSVVLHNKITIESNRIKEGILNELNNVEE